MDLTLSMTLAGVHRTFMPNDLFWTRFFGQQFLSPTPTIVFDEVFEDNRILGKFALPNIVAPVNSETGYEVVSYKPAYMKEKDSIEYWSDSLFNRVPGEQIGGSYSPAQRAELMRADHVKKHTIRMENRFNAMCAQALITGKEIIVGDNYPEHTVDFRRKANHTAVLTGAQAWGQAGVNPLDAIGDMADQLYLTTGGATTDVVFGPLAWKLFHKYLVDTKQAWFSTFTKGADVNFSQIAIGGLKQTAYMGTITGNNGETLNLWVDNTTFIDPVTRLTGRHLGENDVVGIDVNGFKGIQCFGAIKDKKAGNGGLAAMRMFSREIELEEPSADYVLTQSAPLMIPGNTNASWRLTVKQ